MTLTIIFAVALEFSVGHRLYLYTDTQNNVVKSTAKVTVIEEIARIAAMETM